MPKTAEIASPLNGDKLYQERARAALPLLVRQARAAKPIYYSALAEELGMPNPRNLNYVLGSIGQAMDRISKKWKTKVPPIQCLVVNKATVLPGEGIGWFLIKKADFGKLPLRRRREIVQAELQHIYAYPRWDEVLEELELDPAKTDFTKEISIASGDFGGGEGPEHKFLKEYVANNPHAIGLPKSTPAGTTEYRLSSGDVLDVSFQYKKSWVGVEVKSRISDHADITRGIFQCVKYQAVLDAMLISEAKDQNTNTILVLESELPEHLRPLCNLLGVEVIDGVNPH
ncbi:hypothetical protein QN372_06055 [Undibacterium sp. RTI2.1]|uniref:hypothetical protein n=1 Tax=unclassified Undibacterium TaxID=2630295 RepID=UPI002AB3F167|nr:MULTISPECIES: hypothetical protein [unclassified Undibacterium]MDY7540126.1 hypothetical protein [Undibacterium sp. 5I1]MEB0030299.1 hypothetical protein [Undibacterium sp. RTI2.1]MEB0115421.1 hypothetical protein [Undibacterium sp. RTI2.2]MEB0230627.1 hypothetical protein [Undibacterium sp. 10I3]MEB0257053.1 hypothetical protein [Undibacterium sp. 5I1]